MNRLTVVCPSCEATFRIAAEQVGRKGKCGKCSSLFDLREADSEITTYALADNPETPIAVPARCLESSMPFQSGCGSAPAPVEPGGDSRKALGQLKMFLSSLPLYRLTNATAIALVVLVAVRGGVYLLQTVERDRLEELDRQIEVGEGEAEVLREFGEPLAHYIADARLNNARGLRAETAHYHGLVDPSGLNKGIALAATALVLLIASRIWLRLETDDPCPAN